MKHLPFALLFVLLVVFRLLGFLQADWLPNFQPLAAVFFCGALLCRGVKGFLYPLAIWAVTYPPKHFFVEPAAFPTTLAAFAAVFVLGSVAREKKVPILLAGSLVAAVLFHLITCTAAWLGDPMYAKTAHGFWQSTWTGPSGSPLPSWVFLRNMAAANVLFTGLFLLARLPFGRPRSLPSPALAKTH